MKSLISFVIRYIPRPILQIVSPLVLKVLSKFNQGDAVECPICRNHYKKILALWTNSQRKCTLPELPGIGKTPVDVAFSQGENRFFLPVN